MSGRGRSASLPPAHHGAPEVLDPLEVLVVHHRNRSGIVREYDFATLPGTAALRRSLAALFAFRSRAWSSHGSSEKVFRHVRAFATFVSQRERPPRDLDELTASVINEWWLYQKSTQGGREVFRHVTALLHEDPRLREGRVADALARRVPRLPPRQESYESAELDHIKTSALREFRAAWLRIGENAVHLHRWQEGRFAPGSVDARLGQALDLIARTADLPRYDNGNLRRQFMLVVGGTSTEVTWKRLFLDRMEATALGVLLMAEFGWNLAVIDVMPAPTAVPDPGRDGHPTYTVEVWKYKGRRSETENVTDTGAGSPGRLITHALEATRFARVLGHELAPEVDRFIAWRPHQVGWPTTHLERLTAVGPLRFGVDRADAVRWGKQAGTGSPFRRGRRTVVVDRGEPTQHSNDTHERQYVLPDKRIQRDAAAVVAAGAASALRAARGTVRLTARLVDQRSPGHRETATADCSETDNGPAPLPDGGCGASFLLCLGCENARVHADHHPRLAQLHQALANAGTVLPTPAWEPRWGDAFARLEDLRRKVGDGGWQQARARITDADRSIVDELLNGDLSL
ncbi:hypothetical protein ABIA32_006686 [Streptacidiphilus sp. MAP12-20]|uniref:hypothetical protein n=1 Tax=Streptacidiphilus sp. MAP12-20 TaxID=3156299 RepID=UPI003518FD2A